MGTRWIGDPTKGTRRRRGRTEGHAAGPASQPGFATATAGREGKEGFRLGGLIFETEGEEEGGLTGAGGGGGEVLCACAFVVDRWWTADASASPFAVLLQIAPSSVPRVTSLFCGRLKFLRIGQLCDFLLLFSWEIMRFSFSPL